MADTVFRSVIPAVIKAFPQESYEIVEYVVAGIEQRAKIGAPVGPTGVLGNSITHEARRTANGAEGLAISGADYSAYVNYGTGAAGAASTVPDRTAEISYSSAWKGMAARPYFSQAYVDGRTEWDSLWKHLEQRLPKL